MTKTQFIRCHGPEAYKKLVASGKISENPSSKELDDHDEELVRIMALVIPKGFEAYSVLEAIEIVARENEKHPDCLYVTDEHGWVNRKTA